MDEEKKIQPEQEKALPKLISIKELFNGALDVYFGRFGVFFGTTILPVVVGILGKIIIVYYSAESNSPTFFFIGLFLILFSFALNLLSVVAVIYLISNSVTLLNAYKYAITKLLSFMYLGVLSTLMVLGGSLLVVLPGIIVGVWLSFSIYILVYENTKGFEALTKSKAYVRGYWLPVFGRTLFPIVLTLAISFLMGSFFGFGNKLFASEFVTSNYSLISQIIIQFISAAIFPFVMIYQYLLYRDLVSKKLTTLNQQPKENNKYFVGGVVLGVIAIPIFILISYFSGASLNKEILRDGKRYSDLLQIQTRIQLYYRDHNEYPSSLNELTPKYFSVAPLDPLTGNAYEYQIVLNGKGYEVCSALESTSTLACVKSLPEKINLKQDNKK